MNRTAEDWTRRYLAMVGKPYTEVDVQRHTAAVARHLAEQEARAAAELAAAAPPPPARKAFRPA